MVFEFGKISIHPAVWITFLGSIVLAFIITSIVIPSIIKVSRDIGLFDKPDQRKSHTSEIPTLGGVAVFLGMVLPTAIFGGDGISQAFKFILAGLLILFFIGIKDDILVISPKIKLLAELCAIIIVVIFGDIRVTSFHHFLGTGELPYIASVLFTIFMFVVIINGFNLIDGIDGLSAGVGILTVSSLCIWFVLIDEYSLAVFCFSIMGALLAFFYFNVFGKKNKIFLGDTGSLIIGMVVSIFTVKFLETSLTEEIFAIFESAPSIAIGLLIVPLIDTLRVFTLRTLVGKSPFSADRFHTHHKFLLLGYSHLKTTLIILTFNLGMIIFSVLLRNLGNIKVLLIIIPTSIVITSLPGFIFRYKVRNLLVRLEVLGNLSWILPVTFTNLIITNSRRIKFKNPGYLNSAEDQAHLAKKDLDLVLRKAYQKLGGEEAGFEELADDLKTVSKESI